MENFNLVELEKITQDIEKIIENSRNPKVLIHFYKTHKNQDIVLEDWTEESKKEFINRIYNIVTGENKHGQKENFQHGAIRGNQTNPKRQ